MLAVWGRSWDLCWRSWAALGPLWAVLGPSWGLYRRSWLHLGSSWDLCWRYWAALGPPLAVLGRAWSLCGRSGIEKCQEHAYLENVLISRAGARSAAWGSVLSCSWSLCWWSWAALGAYVGGLGLLLGPKLAVLGRLGAGEVGLDAMWSVLGGDQGRNVAQTLAGKPFWGGNVFSTCFQYFRAPSAHTHISIDTCVYTLSVSM